MHYRLDALWKRNANKLERLDESILRFVFNGFNNSCDKLLEEINQPIASLKIRKINDMLTLVFLAIYLKISQLFTESSSSISLKSRRKLVIPSAKTTKYGLHSFRYYASKLWNSSPDSIRVSTSIAAFKAALESLDLDKECFSFCDEY